MRIMMKVIEEAVMESRWKQQICRDIVVDMMEDKVLESRMRLCRQLVEETELDRKDRDAAESFEIL